MSLKAIPTAYKGYRFRSRLEARWAILLDTLGWSWEYELEGFDLGGGDFYLPDFALTGGEYDRGVQCWIEVKPIDPTTDELRKAQKLALQSNLPVAFAIGAPDAIAISEGLGGYDPSSGRYCPHGLVSINSYCRRKWNRPGLLMAGACLRDEDDYAACVSARAARFEHGERCK